MRFMLHKNKNGTMTLPSAALQLSKLEEQPLEYHTGENVVVVMPAKMDAMRLIRTIDALSELELELIGVLQEHCHNGGCSQEECNCVADQSTIQIPDWARGEAGFAPDSKLECWVEEDSDEVIICEAEYEHDISDVPEHLLKLFINIGICPMILDECLVEGDIIYGK